MTTLQKKRDSSKPFVQIEPGQKIFDVLRDVAVSRGLVFMRPPGADWCFVSPEEKENVLFSLIQKAGINSGIIKAEEVGDLTNRFSSYTVLAQEQGRDEGDPVEINAKATVIDDQFPFKGVFKKAFC